MSERSRGTFIAGIATVLFSAPAAAADPPAAEPAAPAAPPSAAPARPAPAARPKGKEPEPELPEPELRFRLIAPSAQGPWTFRLDNEGSRWLRVPADIRLVRLEVESGDTLSKKAAKPVKCAPAALRPEGFPEARALLLGPGDAYVETFDPRLFCFGKESRALEGGALVRARFGWEPPRKGAKKVAPPFAVEGTEFPATVAPMKQLVGPSMVLSYMPPDEPDAAPGDAKAGKDDDPDNIADTDEKPEAPPVVDENAARFELGGTAFVDAVNGFKVAVTLTAANAGHRPTLAAVRPRMMSFRIDGPNGVLHCHASPPSRSIPRNGYQTIKPGGATSMTILLAEACGRDPFRRPGLYKVTPTLHLNESGAEVGVAAFTGVIRAREPTLVRIQAGPESFYVKAPKALKAPRVEGTVDAVP
jgi:hypothetical protein